MNAVERIKKECKDRNIPISRIEKDLGFANGYIGGLRKGHVPSDRLTMIADYLGVSEDYLLTGHEAQGVIEADAPEIFRILHNDNIIEGNPDLKYIVDTVGKWSPEQQKRLRRYVEEVNRIVGGE